MLRQPVLRSARRDPAMPGKFLVPSDGRRADFAAPLLRRTACACGGSCPRCAGRLPPGLPLSQPGDALEREADQMAERVLRRAVPDATSAMTTTNAATPALPGPAAAEAVGEVLRSPGTPLDGELRAWMEPRFGHDLAAVRVHTDAVAARSARAVNALAYSAGEHLVFADGQYRPATDSGRALLAHELAHVVQGRAAGLPRLLRSVASWSNCPDGVNSAPDDARLALATVDARAAEIAANAAALLGAQPPAAETLAAFEARFGLPPEVRGGFLNRLTGRVRPDHDTALGEELRILARRYSLVAGLLAQPIQYVCAGDPASIARARVPNCEAFAWSRRGSGSMVLCPGFWDEIADDDSRSAVVLHESVHILWGRNNPPERGEIRDRTASGPGGAYVNAHCYDELAAALMGTGTPRVRCTPPA